MAVIAIALLAIGNNTRQQVNQVESLRQTSLAGWVADNIVTESRLGLTPGALGSSSGVRRMGDQDWAWSLNVQLSPDPNIVRLDVVVRSSATGNTTALQHTGFSLSESQ